MAEFIIDILGVKFKSNYLSEEEDVAFVNLLKYHGYGVVYTTGDVGHNIGDKLDFIDIADNRIK